MWTTRFLCAILRGACAWTPHGAACRTQETLELSRHCRRSSMVKVQSQGEAGPLGAQPLPRMLELAASKATHVPALDHLGGAALLRAVLPRAQCARPEPAPSHLPRPLRRHLAARAHPGDYGGASTTPAIAEGDGNDPWPAAQQGQGAVWAVPRLGSCTSSGRAWRLWAARHSQEEASPLSAQPPPRASCLQSRPFPRV